MIEADGISFNIKGRDILKDISFRVGKGSFAAIIGPNGAGKTTLIKILIGLLNPTEGNVKIDGSSPKKYLKKRKGILGYLPQGAIVNWNMPLKVLDAVLIENIKSFGFIRKYRKEEIERAKYWLGMFGVEDKVNSYIKHLSGGEQQRVSLARCMINDPELLILDEPNTAVDVVYNVKIYETLKKLCSERNITVLMTTHDIGAVTTYVDEIMCLNVKLHCHGAPSTIDFSKMLRTVYGEGFNVVVHGEQCKNCFFGVNNDRTTH